VRDRRLAALQCASHKRATTAAHALTHAPCRDQALYHNPSSDVKGQASKCAQRSGQRAGSTPAETHFTAPHRWLEHFQVTTEAWQARPSRTSLLRLRPWRA
jgi:hypothetical protein